MLTRVNWVLRAEMVCWAKNVLSLLSSFIQECEDRWLQ
jgi:hypothetical protein